jgi:transcriptional regulator with XRE-family HTH domain
MVTEFGKILRIIRINKNESMRDMAEKFKISAAYLSAIENGKRGIPDNLEDLIIKNYDLTDKDKAKLKKAIMDSTNKIKIDLTDLAEKKKQVYFALQNNKLDESTINKLCEIINKNKK